MIEFYSIPLSETYVAQKTIRRILKVESPPNNFYSVYPYAADVLFIWTNKPPLSSTRTNLSLSSLSILSLCLSLWSILDSYTAGATDAAENSFVEVQNPTEIHYNFLKTISIEIIPVLSFYKSHKVEYHHSLKK